MRIVKRAALAATLMMTVTVATPASAALTLFQSYVGSFGLSTDGGGSLGSNYQVSAFVPVGATVTAAFLYQSTIGSVSASQPVSLNGNALTFSSLVTNPTYDRLGSSRADVTSIVAGIANGGLTGTYDFTVGETGSNVDGTALVVVYQLASLAESTVAILDGYSAISGDTTSLNFATPLDTAQAGFEAEMRLGIGYSVFGQASSVAVNGTTITDVAGNNDDGLGAGADGQLITVGGNDDPFSTLLPGYQDDHERYDLVPYIKTGDTSIRIDTINPSNNDNIFLAAFKVSGRAGVNEPPPAVPEPTTWAMMLTGFGMIAGASRYRRRRTVASIA